MIETEEIVLNLKYIEGMLGKWGIEEEDAQEAVVSVLRTHVKYQESLNAVVLSKEDVANSLVFEVVSLITGGLADE